MLGLNGRRSSCLRPLGRLFLILCLVVPAWARGGVLSIAHRGDSWYAPENTVAAFRSAEGKADLMETDVRVTSDGKLVILHDPTVDRTTDGTGEVSALTLAQLKVLDAGSWLSPAFRGERIPTLEEMITNTVRFATPLLEHKAGRATDYIAELRRLQVVTNVIMMSFDWGFLADLHALEPGLRLCALGSGPVSPGKLAAIFGIGARTLAWNKVSITAAEVALVHRLGLTLYVWTLESPAEIQYFSELGVDGILSSAPARVRAPPAPPTNAPTRLGDQLVAYWPFDDGLADAFATTVADRRGPSTATFVRRDGVSHWLGAGLARLGGCLELAGASAYVTVPRTPALNINAKALTIAAWVRLSRLPSQMTTSCGAIFDSAADSYVLYLDRGNKELRFKVTDVNGHTATPGIPEAFLQTNRWLHLAATYSGAAAPGSGQAVLYLDGQFRDVHTGSDYASPRGLTGKVKPGQIAAMGREGPAGGNGFTGRVDDMAIWRRALTPQEIRRVFEAGRAGKNLAALLLRPPTLIELDSVSLSPTRDSVEIRFHELGPWRKFKLLRADAIAGPFQLVDDLAPIALGDGEYYFVYPLAGQPAGYFRVRSE